MVIQKYVNKLISLSLISIFKNYKGYGFSPEGIL